MICANLGGSLNKKTSFFLDLNRRDITDNSITHATYRGPHDARAIRGRDVGGHAVHVHRAYRPASTTS